MMKLFFDNRLFGIICFIGTIVFGSTLFFPQYEGLGIQHIILGIATTSFLFLGLLIAYRIRYKFDIIDVAVYILWLYFLFANKGFFCFPCPSETYTVQLFLAFFFPIRVLVCRYHIRDLLILLLILVVFFQTLMGLGQFYGMLESRHSLFPITGTFLNPGSYGINLSFIGVILVLNIVSNYHLLKSTLQEGMYRNKNAFFFLLTYFLSIPASICAIIMFVLSGSRSALFGFFIPVLIFAVLEGQLWNRFKDTRYKKAFAAFGLFVTLILLTIAYLIRPESANGRLHIWRVSLNEIDCSFIGTGVGTFPKQYIIAQEKYYLKHGFVSKWIKYADTPQYSFNEFLNVFYEEGLVGVLLFLVALFLILRQMLFSTGNRFFVYGLISILIISITSYPLHLFPVSIIFVCLMAAGGSFRRGVISNINSLLLLSFLFIFSMLSLPNYVATVNATMKWNAMKQVSEISILDIREEENYVKLLNNLSSNGEFLLDYAVFLIKKREYLKSVEILKSGHEISGNPEFALLLAEVYACMGDISEAEKYYVRAFMMVPNRLTPLYKLAIFYYETMQYDRFEEIAYRIMSFSPKVKSLRTDKMKKDVRDMLDIINDNSKNETVK